MKVNLGEIEVKTEDMEAVKATVLVVIKNQGDFDAWCGRVARRAVKEAIADARFVLELRTKNKADPSTDRSAGP